MEIAIYKLILGELFLINKKLQRLFFSFSFITWSWFKFIIQAYSQYFFFKVLKSVDNHNIITIIIIHYPRRQKCHCFLRVLIWVNELILSVREAFKKSEKKNCVAVVLFLLPICMYHFFSSLFSSGYLKQKLSLWQYFIHVSETVGFMKRMKCGQDKVCIYSIW